jgi:hypothetical protein
VRSNDWSLMHGIMSASANWQQVPAPEKLTWYNRFVSSRQQEPLVRHAILIWDRVIVSEL